jgi:CAAX protease family protein
MDHDDGGSPEAMEPAHYKTNFLVGKSGLRVGWRLLIYLAMVVGGGVVIATVAQVIFHPHPGGMMTGWILLWEELIGFALVFGGAVIMCGMERRPLGEYGLPASDVFGKKFWLGFLFGLLEISVLIWLIRMFGGYSFGTVALQGSEIIKMGLLYLVGFTFVGLFEEFLFRGYTQYTLGEAIGFWPAALVLSLLFGSAHLMNPGEGWVGAASVVMIALFFCFSLRRTGNLWYAVGLHASFDWGETFLYSVPNSGAIMKGHLSNALLQAGPKWLTGGTVGPEGSVFCFLTIALQFLMVMWLFPAKGGEPRAERAT